MDTKWILPTGLLVAGAGAGYVIWRRMTAVPPQIMPGVPGPAMAPGVSAQYGRFNIFVPFQGITDIISAVTDGGTKPDRKAVAPVTATVPTGPTLKPEAGGGEPYIMPYMPGI